MEWRENIVVATALVQLFFLFFYFGGITDFWYRPVGSYRWYCTCCIRREASVLPGHEGTRDWAMRFIRLWSFGLVSFRVVVLLALAARFLPSGLAYPSPSWVTCLVSSDCRQNERQDTKQICIGFSVRTGDGHYWCADRLSSGIVTRPSWYVSLISFSLFCLRRGDDPFIPAISFTNGVNSLCAVSAGQYLVCWFLAGQRRQRRLV